jgi:hypothetical protein
MPYSIGGKGDSIGCEGYGVLDQSGKVVGCHATRSEAEMHVAESYKNLEDVKADGVASANPSFTIDPKYPGVGIKRPSQGGPTTGSKTKSKYGKKPKSINTGRNSDNNSSAGSISSGGPGGSLG